MMLTNLASVARSSGLKVVEVPGWKTRGHGEMTAVEAIVCHHTAGAATGDYPSLGVVRDGRKGLAGPLAQLGLGRTGTVYVIAAGVCYHAGATFYAWQNNWHAIGIEAEATGTDAWPDVQYDAYARLCAALRHEYVVPNVRVLGHKEVARPLGRKPDPNFDMTTFRAAVARAYAGDTNQEEFTVSQYQDLIDETKRQGDATRQEIRRQAIWAMRYGAQTEDERAQADAAFDAVIEKGGTLAEALAAVRSVMAPINADLDKRAKDNG